MIVIETKRLILRQYKQDDFDGLKDIITDPETMKYYLKPYDLKGVQRWLDWNYNNYEKLGFGLWAIELKETGEYIGDCGITIQNIDEELLPEIGYHINKLHWKKGYAKEAGQAVRDWGFENTKYDALYSYMNFENIPSYKTALSLGMEKVNDYVDSSGERLFVCKITRSKWLSNKL